MAKWVYSFGDGKAEGRAEMRNLLGGKGANLAEMSALGLPVPPGFTITTECCTHFYANDRQYPADLKDQVAAGIAKVEQIANEDCPYVIPYFYDYLHCYRNTFAGVRGTGLGHYYLGQAGFLA